MTVDQIQKAVAEHYGLKQADMISVPVRQEKRLLRNRQVADGNLTPMIRMQPTGKLFECAGKKPWHSRRFFHSLRDH